MVGHDIGPGPARPEYGDLGRRDDGRYVAGPVRTGIGQRDGRAAQFFRRHGPRLDIGVHAVEAAAQVRGIPVGDVAQHGDEQAIVGVYGDTEVDLGMNPDAFRGAVVPAVELGYRRDTGGQRPHQPHGDVLPRLPILDIRILHHGRGGNLGVGLRHTLRHGPPHAAKRFERFGFRDIGRGLLDIADRDNPSPSGRRHQIQVDPELSRQRADRRRRLDRRTRPSAFRFHAGLLGDRIVLRAQTADHAAGIVVRSLGKTHQRTAHFDHVTGLGEQFCDAAGLRRRHFDHRLVGFHAEQRLIGNHRVALMDMPGDDLGLLQAFAKIGKQKITHWALRMLFGRLTGGFVGEGYGPAGGGGNAVRRHGVTVFGPRAGRNDVITRHPLDRREEAQEIRARQAGPRSRRRSRRYRAPRGR